MLGLCSGLINGLGFSDKPLSLTPHFFETKALEVLFRAGIESSDFNRHKLGKVLDKAHAYGCEQLFYELSWQSCVQEGIDLRFNSEDTTTLTVTGEYDEDVDEHTIHITHGYSKDHRPDLKQVVQELLVSQDGGVPLMMKSWDGNASDSKIFAERSKGLIEYFKQAQSPRYLIADSKLYSKENAKNLEQLSFITRIPGTLKEEQSLITHAIELNQWQRIDETNRYYEKQITHYGIVQRWIVVHSDAAQERARNTLQKAVKKEHDQIEKQLWHLSNKPFACSHDAKQAVDELAKGWHYHGIQEVNITEKRLHAGLGRPAKGAQPEQLQYFVIASASEDEAAIKVRLNERSCYVIGTNIDEKQLPSADVINAYKRQNASIENMGFRFLKDPIFFVSSLFLKKPSRIMGLLMVMTLALLVYSIAQRRLRRALAEQNETIPNQIKQPSKTPTMRWIFQLMDGLHFVTFSVNGEIQRMVQGWSPIKEKIIMLLGQTTQQIYGLQQNSNFSPGGSSI